MNNLLDITAALDQPALLENLVEKLASRRYDIGYCKQDVPKNWQAVEVASAEVYTSGTLSFPVIMETDESSIHMPFITSMLFTCIKGEDDRYRLLWSSSLS
jgi:hypothetical protein